MSEDFNVLSYRKPKHNKIRTAFVIGYGMGFVKEWLSIPKELRDAYRAGENRIPRTI